MKGEVVPGSEPCSCPEWPGQGRRLALHEGSSPRNPSELRGYLMHPPPPQCCRKPETKLENTEENTIQTIRLLRCVRGTNINTGTGCSFHQKRSFSKPRGRGGELIQSEKRTGKPEPAGKATGAERLHGPGGAGQQGISSQRWEPAGLRAWGLLHTSMGDLARRPVGCLRCGH